jgi:hypothetical protein
MSIERRDTLRIPDNRLITEMICERPSASSIVNLSSTGIYTVKSKRDCRINGPRKIQVEIPLPEASEAVWALGEIVFERQGMSALGMGIRFLAMANYHKVLLRDLVESRRQQMVTQMLQIPILVEHNDMVCESPLGSKREDDTAKMYSLY